MSADIATGEARTNQHYDIDPEIFGAFLGLLRKYSSGIYLDPDQPAGRADDLDAAQDRKLRFVADRLGLTGGERLLDIGCGWGSLVLFMAAEYDCDVVGISPAARQHDYIARRAADLGLGAQVATMVGEFEKTRFDDRSFDAVTLLGSIVHMPDLDDIFARARAVLRPGGSLYVSESCFRNAASRATFDDRSGTEFVRDAIFGNGDMRPLSDLVRGAENAGLSIVAVDDLTRHYHRTIEDWLVNVETNRDRIEALRPGYSDELIRYLQVANAGWGFTTKHYALTCRRAR